MAVRRPLRGPFENRLRVLAAIAGPEVFSHSLSISISISVSIYRCRARILISVINNPISRLISIFDTLESIILLYRSWLPISIFDLDARYPGIFLDLSMVAVDIPISVSISISISIPISICINVDLYVVFLLICCRSCRGDCLPYYDICETGICTSWGCSCS